jgi:dihydrolipoamide dehydrogenase
MDQFDFVIIGGGGAGEAAAHEARRRGATVAIIDRELFGGSCPFWACMPSKTLLHAASIHAAGGEYPWPKASDRRDYMINREQRDWPDDGGHTHSLAGAGAEVIRGEARITGPGSVRVRLPDGGDREVRGRFIVIAVGTNATIPDLPGIESIEPWTNRQATSTRTLPRSLAILGGGPTGVEMAQVFARYGVPVTLVHSETRLNHRDHPRNSEALAAALVRDGVQLRLGRRAERVKARAGHDGAHVVHLSDGTTIEGHEIMFAIGRTAPLSGLGLETIGVELRDGRVKPDESLRIARGTFVIGDAAGPEMHTHLAHYQGEIVVRIALGESVRPDFRAIPRAVYTDPETAGVGLGLDEAVEQGLDAFEKTADLALTAKGYVAEASGHVTIVVDRASRTLVGAFIAGPAASEAIHLAVLAVKTRTPIDVLADTITAFPTTARVMGGLFVEAARDLAIPRISRPPQPSTKIATSSRGFRERSGTVQPVAG